MPVKSTRIGFDATAAVTQGGGIGRYTRELLRALVQEGNHYCFRIFAGRSPEAPPIDSPIPSGAHVSFRQLPLSPRWLYRIWYRLRLPLPVQVFTGSVDLFHSPDFVLPPVMGNIPTILTVHDLSFALYPETFTPALVNYLERVVPWSVRRATHILADSESTRQDLIRLYGTPETKITVLYSGVHARFNTTVDEDAVAKVREKYEIGEAPFAFTVSTLQPRKNHQLLIRAFRDVASQTNHNLIIAGGRGWLYEKMLEEVEQQGLQERVRFIGFVDDGDLPALYNAASLFVFPSLYEGFGLPVLEAMACGTPVVSSNASSLPEVTGDAAVQLSPHDEAAWTGAMLRVINDRALRNRLIATGHSQAQRFRWSGAARKLLELYGRVLGRDRDALS